MIFTIRTHWEGEHAEEPQEVDATKCDPYEAFEAQVDKVNRYQSDPEGITVDLVASNGDVTASHTFSRYW